MKKVFLAVVLTSLFFSAFSQKYKTLAGKIDIYSKTTLFTIEATNKKAACTLDSAGKIAATVPVLSFDFKEALVEEHFNENYMETTKEVDGKQVNLKSTLTANIDDLTKVDFKKNGTYNVTFSGKLKIHNTTNTVSKIPAKLVVSATGVKVTTNFDVSLAAYNIKVEESYKDRINDAITLKIDFDLAPVK